MLSEDCRVDVDGELAKLDSDGYRASRIGPGLLPRTPADASTDPIGSEAG